MKNKIPTINEFSKVTEYQINIHKSIVFLILATNKQVKTGVKNRKQYLLQYLQKNKYVINVTKHT